MKILHNYLMRHWHALHTSTMSIGNKPLSSLAISLVIGVALALPVILWLMLNNAEVISKDWGQGGQISLFLQRNLSQAQQQHFFQRIKVHHGVGQARFITPQQGLRDLQQHGGFGDAVKQLPESLLPAVIEITPQVHINTPGQVNRLYTELEGLPEVAIAKLDLGWVKRMHAIINLARHVVDGLMMLLSVTVLLVVGNTIRLAIQNRHQEIEVLKLIGDTNPFIRRPFLYSGALYGLLGAVLALLIVGILELFLAGSVQNLANLYEVSYTLTRISIVQCVIIIMLGVFLGWLGARIAVNRQIAAIEPESQ